MAVNLTEDAISLITSGEWQGTGPKPVVQVMDIRAVQTQTQAAAAGGGGGGGGGGENKERYRVVLSDGKFHQQGMLATQHNDLVRSEQLQKGSIIQLTDFVCNTIRDRVIVIIIDVKVILGKHDIIGEPKPFSFKPPSNENPPTARAPPPMQPCLNHLATTISGTRSFNENSFNGSVARPNPNVAPPVYIHERQNIAGSHSFPDPSNNNHMPQIQTSYNQPPPMYTNRGPMSKNEAPPRIIPIAALNPYQGKWTIKARVTVKGELRRYNNSKGEGKVFSFDLVDSDGGEIRATCFNAVADQFFNQLEVGKVYFISKGTIKPAQKAFNHLKNDFEITLDNSSTIQQCFDDDTSIPRQQFHFRSIGDIEGLDNNTVLDIIGVVTSITPSTSIMRKNGVETQKQTLYLKDKSGRSIEFTLWGNFCNSEGQTLQSKCDSGLFPVLAVKSARVYEFNGKSIGTISTSQLFIDPDFPEACELKTWFETVGKNTPSVSMSIRDSVPRIDVFKTISQIKDEKLGTSDKPDWITINATIFHMKLDNFCYTACPAVKGDRKCSKKVMQAEDGKWRCEKCVESFDECDYRYILQLQIQDHTGTTWITAFQETGEEILGVSAKDLFLIKYEEQNEDKFFEIVHNARFSEYTFKLKVKEESFNEELRVKSTVAKAEKIKFSSHAKFLLHEIQKMHNNSKSEIPDSEVRNAGVKETAPLAPHVASAMSYGGNSGAPSGECYKCHKSGHWARDCPGVSNGVGAYGSESGGFSGGGNSGASGECYKCQKSGHWARDCPGVSNGVARFGGGSGGVSGGGSGGSSGECYKCHQMGHWARDCPGGVSTGLPSYGR